jgi:hypothetical protein
MTDMTDDPLHPPKPLAAKVHTLVDSIKALSSDFEEWQKIEYLVVGLMHRHAAALYQQSQLDALQQVPLIIRDHLNPDQIEIFKGVRPKRGRKGKVLNALKLMDAKKVSDSWVWRENAVGTMGSDKKLYIDTVDLAKAAAESED